MAGFSPVASPEISALIQINGASNNGDSLKAMKALQKSAVENRGGESEAEKIAAREKAVETANKFEALLIHSMLKSMRKTTMAENTTNQRAMYDDMLDKNLADTMVESGGLGVAKQLLEQLDGGRSQREQITSASVDRNRLRALAVNDGEKLTITEAQPETPVTNIIQLRMAAGIWANAQPAEKRTFKEEFTEPLQPHAQRSADRLGTSPNTILAIAALETGWGRNMLKDTEGQSTNNYFGIKASSTDTQFSENLTTEFIDGGAQKVQARFKAYDTAADSIEGFADFIIDNPRYSKAIEHAGDPERFLTELQKAGYATDPQYAKKAISILHQINQQSAQL